MESYLTIFTLLAKIPCITSIDIIFVSLVKILMSLNVCAYNMRGHKKTAYYLIISPLSKAHPGGCLSTISQWCYHAGERLP